ncbi:MAG: hypothetical protein ACTSRA_06170 [Promethearchaeota archaeon]
MDWQLIIKLINPFVKILGELIFLVVLFFVVQNARRHIKCGLKRVLAKQERLAINPYQPGRILKPGTLHQAKRCLNIFIGRWLNNNSTIQKKILNEKLLLFLVKDFFSRSLFN